MTRSRNRFLGALVATLLVGGTVGAQDVFTLGFQGPDSLVGAVGSAVSGEYACTLGQEGAGDGAQGWSISLTADGAEIAAIATAGTDAAALFSGGFEKTELTATGTHPASCPGGQDGAVSAMVLSFTQPITLVANGTSSIARITVESEIPAGGGSCRVYYADGCQGAGQPVDNKVTQSGATIEPVLGERMIQLVEKVTCVGARLSAGFTAQAVTGPGDLLSFVRDEEDPESEASGGTIAVETALGATGVAEAFVGLASNVTDNPATPAVEAGQGWSLAIALEGDGTLEAAGTEGTTGGTAPPNGMQSGGFEKTELVDPAKEPTSGDLSGLGPQGQGAVSAVVLSFTQPITLPPVGVESLLKLTVAAAAPQTDLVQTARLYLKNGLQGAGQPVNNVVTVAGATEQLCNRGTAEVSLAFGPSLVKVFRRGDANDDSKVDLADPIYVINALFRSGPAVACEDAADTNDDGQVDSTDAVYVIDYLFRALSAPAAPFPDCGEDPTEDGLSCGEDGFGC